ncbi:MAG: heme o synthase [Acidocella sp.]|nr:heme o synthase [Acidocella sp.]
MSASASDYVTLLKPRVLTLVVFTGAIGLVIAPNSINPFLGLTAIFCITIAAGAAGAINMWYDRDIDAIMKRTANRPIPAGRLSAESALAFGVILAVLSVLVMFLATNAIAALTLALSIAFYVFVYTMWLKRLTPQNIVIGGAAGAFPPVIGWAAATGNITALPFLLFAIIFIWTPPHFWALSLYASGDYERAGVPMLPVVRGARHTRICVMVYTLLLVPVTLAPFVLGLAGRIYGLSALILGAVFVAYAWATLNDAQDETGKSLTRDRPAKAMFRYSILYLFLLFGACALDRLI